MCCVCRIIPAEEFIEMYSGHRYRNVQAMRLELACIKIFRIPISDVIVMENHDPNWNQKSNRCDPQKQAIMIGKSSGGLKHLDYVVWALPKLKGE